MNSPEAFSKLFQRQPKKKCIHHETHFATHCGIQREQIEIVVNIWLLVVLFLVIVACLALWPVLRAFSRNVRTLMHAQSPDFRLQMANCWTEIQQGDGGSVFQMMRMKDGNILFLSIGSDTAKVFVTPRLDTPASFNEMASFPIAAPSERRRAKEEEILNGLRTAIGWPESIDELQRVLKAVRADFDQF